LLSYSPSFGGGRVRYLFQVLHLYLLNTSRYGV
jgi:hypothetical protein